MDPHRARRILIYRIGSLGDTVVALPALHRIARSFPHAHRMLLTNFPVHAKAPLSAAVLEGSGLVHDYMRYRIGSRNPLALLDLALRIRRYHPDVLIGLLPERSLRAVRRDEFFFRHLCGIGNIVGLPHTADALSNRFDAETQRWESEAVRLARSIAELGDVEPERLENWELRLTTREQEMADALLAPLQGQPFLVCAPGTKMLAKDWGGHRWRELLARLSRRYPQCALVMAGAAEERLMALSVAQEWRGTVLNLCGATTPRQTAAVLRRAACFLGPDSGPMHLAACVGTPCVIAFAARGLPGVWFPVGTQHHVFYNPMECLGCRLEVCTEKQNRCLEQISVAQMEAAVIDVIAAAMQKEAERVALLQESEISAL